MNPPQGINAHTDTHTHPLHAFALSLSLPPPIKPSVFARIAIQLMTHSFLDAILSPLPPQYHRIAQSGIKDPIKMEKFQATKRNKKNVQLLPALVQLCLRVVMVGLFLSSPHWLPVLCSSARFFFTETLPGACALLSRPKCLFIISNVIIIFLVGESKLSRPTSPQQLDIYEAYMARRQSLQNAVAYQVVCQPQVAEATVVEEAPPVEETKELVDEVAQEEAQEEECGKEDGVIDREREEELEEQEDEVAAAEEEEEEEEDEEEELGLPAEELNRRVEDFIAKVNMQRKLEAKMLLLCY